MMGAPKIANHGRNQMVSEEEAVAGKRFDSQWRPFPGL